jgi:hypothetical protein
MEASTLGKQAVLNYLAMDTLDETEESLKEKFAQLGDKF